MTDRDRLAADLHSSICDYHWPDLLTCGIDHADDADRLIALGWTRLDGPADLGQQTTVSTSLGRRVTEKPLVLHADQCALEPDHGGPCMWVGGRRPEDPVYPNRPPILDETHGDPGPTYDLPGYCHTCGTHFTVRRRKGWKPPLSVECPACECTAFGWLIVPQEQPPLDEERLARALRKEWPAGDDLADEEGGEWCYGLEAVAAMLPAIAKAYREDTE